MKWEDYYSAWKAMLSRSTVTTAGWVINIMFGSFLIHGDRLVNLVQMFITSLRYEDHDKI